MTKIVLAFALAALLLLTVSVFADPPTITTPQEGAQVGPSVVVEGTAPGATHIDVWTEAYNADKGQLLSKVPGLKHAVGEGGTFRVRVAIPRVYFGDKVALRYEIHAQSSSGEAILGDAKVVVGGPAQAPSAEAVPDAGEAPIVTAPTAEQEVGPNVDVVGRAQPSALVVIWTEVYNAETNENLLRVPGIRHAANEDGTFHFRVSVPRVSVGETVSLRYEIKVIAGVNRQYTAETVVVVNYQKG